MTDKQPIFSHEIDWKGTAFVEEFYEANDFSNISPITQVQAVTFISENNIALFEHVDGYFSLPGGKVEVDETLEETLKRECIEEMQAEVLAFVPIGYFKNWRKDSPENVTYNVRFAALVKLLDKAIEDPCKKAIGRKVVSVKDAAKELNWGKKGEILIRTALLKIPSL